MEVPHNTSTVIFKLMLLCGFIITWASGEGREIAVAVDRSSRMFQRFLCMKKPRCWGERRSPSEGDQPVAPTGPF